LHAQIDSLIMKHLKEFKIPFIGLKQGSHLFEFDIDNTFFENFGFDEYLESNISVDVDFLKKPTLFELTFTIKGSVKVICDISLEPYNQEIESTYSLIVKFGEEYNDENDEILIIPHEAYEVDLSQFIYEFIVLSVPNKRIHPKVIDGSLDSETIKRLKDLEIKEEATATDTVDPRWDKLKDLLTE